jgi:uncharacterized membrane protein
MFPTIAPWRRDALRTNLWFVPMLEVIGAICLYLVTHALDQRVYSHELTLPSWMIFGSADAARTILTALAAAVITVVGIVFSITIVTLTLASTQFGPRMLRNFMRDRGTHWTLGTFVATFVYTTLVMISVGSGEHVPHLSITVSVELVTVSMGVLIYFIHHIATSIQLPNVIASIAAQRGAVIRLLHRPGHFIVRNHPIATVWPPEAVAPVSQALSRAHITGPNRTLVQDLAFAVDQLVEIAIRGLSPAVNDTFTALTCIDWLGESLCGSPPAGIRFASTATPAGSCA